MKFKGNLLSLLLLAAAISTYAQTPEKIKLVKSPDKKRIDVYAGDKPFTSFIYPDSLEKPVLYPVRDAAGVPVTRGFPLEPRPGEPTDHPHHMGIWFTYENVNGLDFWNNSYAIAQDKKHLYGWVRTDRILETANGTTGKLVYHANWTNQQKEVLLDEDTRYQFSAAGNQRIIDRFRQFEIGDASAGLQNPEQTQVDTIELDSLQFSFSYILNDEIRMRKLGFVCAS